MMGPVGRRDGEGGGGRGGGGAGGGGGNELLELSMDTWLSVYREDELPEVKQSISGKVVYNILVV